MSNYMYVENNHVVSSSDAAKVIFLFLYDVSVAIWANHFIHLFVE